MRMTGTNKEVAAAFAADRDAPERNGRGSLFQRGDKRRTIYSYGDHFPIARHAGRMGGRPLVLFTTAEYSTTTRGHKDRVRAALEGWYPFDQPPHPARIIYVPDPTADTPKAHAENVAELLGRATALMVRGQRARRLDWGGALQEDARRLVKDAVDYARRFRVPVRAADVPILDGSTPRPPRLRAPAEAKHALNALLLAVDVCERNGTAPAWARMRQHLDTVARALGGRVEA